MPRQKLLLLWTLAWIICQPSAWPFDVAAPGSGSADLTLLLAVLSGTGLVACGLPPSIYLMLAMLRKPRQPGRYYSMRRESYGFWEKQARAGEAKRGGRGRCLCMAPRVRAAAFCRWQSAARSAPPDATRGARAISDVQY